MKFLFFFAFLLGCTQKYADYDLIRKSDYNQKSYERPVTQMQVVHAGNDTLDRCFNQWLFFSNAEKEKDEHLPMMVRTLCPREPYLTQTRMTETWWTTIVFTRSCIDIKTACAKDKRP